MRAKRQSPGRGAGGTLTRDAGWGYLLTAPTVLGLLILNVYPFIETLILSFSRTQAFGSYAFSGLENYTRMFGSSEFWRATWNTLYFCLLTVPVGVFLSLLVAVLLNQGVRGRAAFRAIYFLPMVVPPAAVALVWKWMLNARYGVVNGLLGLSVRWITDPSLVLISCAIVAIWSAVGYDAVLLLSGIQSISPTYYEAAELDGATPLQRFFCITLPLISPTLFFVVILRVMSSLKVYDLIYMIVEQSNPSLPYAQSLMYLFYRESFIAGDKGFGSAVVVWTVLLIGVTTLFQFTSQQRWVHYES